MPGFAWWKETSRVTPRAGNTVALLRDMAGGLLALICGARPLAAARLTGAVVGVVGCLGAWFA